MRFWSNPLNCPHPNEISVPELIFVAAWAAFMLASVFAGMALFRACRRCAMGSVYGEDGR